MDVLYEGEIVRAKFENQSLTLHQGGDRYIHLPLPNTVRREQVSPSRENRFMWMLPLIEPSHYIYGAGEAEYLHFKDFPTVTFVPRKTIEHPNLSWLG